MWLHSKLEAMVLQDKCSFEGIGEGKINRIAVSGFTAAV
jgi:hypothetical protein